MEERQIVPLLLAGRGGERALVGYLKWEAFVLSLPLIQVCAVVGDGYSCQSLKLRGVLPSPAGYQIQLFSPSRLVFLFCEWGKLFDETYGVKQGRLESAQKGQSPHMQCRITANMQLEYPKQNLEAIRVNILKL